MKKNILAIANDAGGAEIMGAYLKANRKELSLHAYISGPAVNVFKRLRLPHEPAPHSYGALEKLIAAHARADLTLIGTGWMTTLERDALAIAEKLGMKTAVYLESWMSYKPRFGYPKKGWNKNIPSTIWVGDRYAYAIAKREFPRTTVSLVNNEYFAGIKARYKNFRGKKTKDILFLSNKDRYTKMVFEKLLAYCAHTKRPPTIRVRFHPADDRAQFDALIRAYPGKVIKSKGRDIVRDLVHARIVIGTETTAMAAAAIVGKKTVSIVLPGAPSTLPFERIIKVSSVEKALPHLEK